jgi:Sec7-like guanine-nucleotide exchange factor
MHGLPFSFPSRLIFNFADHSDITASALRKAYLATFDYSNMEFDKALRAFLSRLILPVETEKIDRLIESFARRYHENNPTLFATSGM